MTSKKTVSVLLAEKILHMIFDGISNIYDRKISI